MLPDADLRKQFAARRVRQYLLTILLIVFALAFRWLAGQPQPPLGLPPNLLVLLLFGFIGAAIIFSFFNWRCPACGGKYLGRAINPKFCASCGFRLASNSA